MFESLSLTMKDLVDRKVVEISQKAPEILFKCGVISLIGAVGGGIYAGKKYNDVMDDHNKRVEAAKKEFSKDEDEGKLRSKVTKEYVKTGAKMVAIHTPAAAATIISIKCFSKMKNDYAARLADAEMAIAGLRSYISKYQEKNRELNGEDAHEACKYGTKTTKYTDEDGYTNEKVEIDDELKGYHDHMYEFSAQTSGLFKEYTSGNRNLLLWVNHEIKVKLQNRTVVKGGKLHPGFVTVNEVLDMLDMLPLTSHGTEKDSFISTRGLVEGWVYGVGEEPNIICQDPINRDFFAGKNYKGMVIYLEFNISGNIASILKDYDKKER